MRSLIRAFASRLNIQWVLSYWLEAAQAGLSLVWEDCWLWWFFQRSSLGWFPIVGRLTMALVYCGGLHAWWSVGHVWRLCFPLWLHAGGSDIRLYDGSDLETHLLVGWWRPGVLAVCRAHRGLPVGLFCSGVQFYLLLCLCLCFVSLLCLDLNVLGDDALIRVFYANQISMCLDPHLS